MQNDPTFLHQKIANIERRSAEQINQLKEELARERAKYRAMESKLEEFQAQTEKQANKRLDDAAHENQLLRTDLDQERSRINDFQQLLSDFGQFAGEKIQLLRRLEISEEQRQDLELQLDLLKQQALADAAQRTAAFEIDKRKAVEDAVAEKLARYNQDVGRETKLLRIQNIELQKGIQLLKKQSKPVSEGFIGQKDVQRYELSVKQEMERKIGEQSNQIIQMQVIISDFERKYEAEKQQVSSFVSELLKKFESEKQHYKQELRSLEKLVYIKCKELYRLRTISALILQKRTDLESMLYETMRASVPLGSSSFYLEKQYPKTMKEMQRNLIQGIRVVPSQAVQDMGAETMVEVVSSWISQINGQEIK
ncbi:hypothetical protein SS50377_25831 [Spironucleus salmonicida]|nr:hypothetical protein SS50377_25831 [Spironucleus salmonicida]|eukprot:EST46773.1 hypothetical protein SS50377_13199 [Spironucleus salmonicida]